MVSIDVGGNPINYLIRYKKEVQRITDKFRPDIISVCDDGLKGFFIPTIIKTQAKIIYERHASIALNTDSSLKGKLVKWLMVSLSATFDCYIVLTRQNAKEWQGRNLKILPNPLSFYPDETSTLNHKRIIVVGSHSYNKGYDTLLLIWKDLTVKFNDWHLDIFGKIDKDQIFIKLAEKNGIKNCNFYPPTPDIEKEYLQSDILFLSSRSEGFGMVLIEAMACGVPCIAFDCPSGPRDIISDSQDGFLIENQNIKHFISKATELISHEAERKKMGMLARQKANCYRAERIVSEWDKLFRELIK